MERFFCHEGAKTRRGTKKSFVQLRAFVSLWQQKLSKYSMVQECDATMLKNEQMPVAKK